MKHHREELWFNTPDRRAYIDITDRVEQAVRESGVHNGLCLVPPCPTDRTTHPYPQPTGHPKRPSAAP